MTDFNFSFSLSTLNHLWRKLYRNFLTILWEAISNSWDADAKNVRIIIDNENKTLIISDDGVGMNADDFRNKFLNIWYSKRHNWGFLTRNGRPVIGRKWIWKLALLSSADRITILTKKEWMDELIWWVIDNSWLNELIENEPNLASHDYRLPNFWNEDSQKFPSDFTTWTTLILDWINISNTENHIRKILALYFQFSLIDPSFRIVLNWQEISHADLTDLDNKTQFIWNIWDHSHPQSDKVKSSIDPEENTIKGFIASVYKPKDLQVLWLNEKIWIDLFVNGRVRETNILKHFPDFSSRFIASYLYWQLHIDSLDTGNSEDIFASSREWILPDSQAFMDTKDSVSKILNRVSQEWDEFRRADWDEWDTDSWNIRISKYEALTEQSQAIRKKDAVKKIENNENLDKNTKASLKEELKQLSSTHVTIYQDIFIMENLMRRYLVEKWIDTEHLSSMYKKLSLKKHKNSQESKFLESLNSSIEIHKLTKQLEIWHDLENNILMSYDNILNFATLSNLFIFLDTYAWTKKWDERKSLPRSAEKTFEARILPIRNAVMHTNQLTQEALKYWYIKTIIDLLERLP